MSENAQASPRGATLDKAALQRKYRQERDKRLRPDGNEQYLQLQGRLAHYLEDPYTPRTPHSASAAGRPAIARSAASARLW